MLRTLNKLGNVLKVKAAHCIHYYFVFKRLILFTCGKGCTFFWIMFPKILTNVGTLGRDSPMFKNNYSIKNSCFVTCVNTALRS
jgi:hypothetical protein